MKHLPKLFAITLAVAPLASHGLTYSQGPATDQTITDSNGDGVGDGLLAANDVYLRTFGVSSVWRSALEFDISSLPENILVTSANFYIVAHGTVTIGDQIQVFGYSADGIVNISDYAHTGNQVGLITLNSHPQADNINVTTFIQNLVNANGNFAGFLLKSPIEGSFHGADFASSEWSQPSLRPQLTIEYSQVVQAPELTSSLALFGFGLTGLTIFNRKRP